MNIGIGLDSGSTTTELAVVNEEKEILYLKAVESGLDINQTANMLLMNMREQFTAPAEDRSTFVVTGYGRKHIEIKNFEKIEKTEITCYGKGAHFLNEHVRTILDIGGQDSKAIAVGKNGKVKNFAMNDKCAAGTGRFLDMISKHFNLSFDQLGSISVLSTKEIHICNICAVFAESEMISLVSQGTKVEDIIKAVEKSIVKRVLGMAERVGIADEIMFCGGVAKNNGMVTTLEEHLQRKVFVPEHVEFVGSIGAALFCLEESALE